MVGQRKKFWFLKALKTTDWCSKFLGQYFLHSFENDTKIDLYMDKMVSIPLITDYRNKNIWLGKKFIV